MYGDDNELARLNLPSLALFNTLRPRQNGRLFADDTFKRIFLNEIVRISIKISLKFVPKGLINNIPALVKIMAWRRPGDKPLSEPMMVRLLTHICVTRPQWVNIILNTCPYACRFKAPSGKGRDTYAFAYTLQHHCSVRPNRYTNNQTILTLVMRESCRYSYMPSFYYLCGYLRFMSLHITVKW